MVKKRLSKASFICTMCKQSQFHKHRYIHETFEILPHCPKRELIVCEKCIRREMGIKARADIEDYYKDE